MKIRFLSAPKTSLSDLVLAISFSEKASSLPAPNLNSGQVREIERWCGATPSERYKPLSSARLLVAVRAGAAAPERALREREPDPGAGPGQHLGLGQVERRAVAAAAARAVSLSVGRDCVNSCNYC